MLYQRPSWTDITAAVARAEVVAHMWHCTFVASHRETYPGALLHLGQEKAQDSIPVNPAHLSPGPRKTYHKHEGTSLEHFNP